MPFTDSDRRLLDRCLNREPGGWEQFVDRFVGVLVHVIRHTSHAHSWELTQDDMEDLCSEVFITLLKNDMAVLRHFKGRSSLPSYLTVVARRIVVKASVQRRRSAAMGHVRASVSALHAGSGDSAAMSAEEVRTLLGRLSAPEAAVVRMYHLEGKSYHEISAVLGIAENSIGPTLHRARDKMRGSVSNAS